MGEFSKIQWCHHTFNLWWGCVKVSPGCENCYAEAAAKRYGFDVWGHGKEYRQFGEKHWNEPRKWNRNAFKLGERHRVFCASMMDVFDPAGPESERTKLWPLIEETPNLDWLLLTKRPQHMLHFMWHWRTGAPSNMWLLTTVEDQRRANERIPEVLYWRTKAALVGLSVEPQLEHIDLTPWLHELDWVIVGGESGHKARPNHVDWTRSIVQQCNDFGVACFVKQLGKRVLAGPVNGELINFKPKHLKGGDPEEWPPDLRVRQFPLARPGTRV